MTDVLLQIANALVLGLEAVGIAVIIGGFVLATVVWLVNMRRMSTHEAYVDYRRRSVRGLILGLEFLVAADIIMTVAIEYSMENVLMLALIILIRTLLVFALHLEIEGRLPWTQSEYDSKT
ncbi:DUF1622 domain-containing protein [Thioalkalivibrio sp. ALJ1]|uniref:DUF1622 domain-containing protein n=1 Tax=Thioalkalivibrio sp. ALJ1 TaxID=1158144 RepID=UPI00056E90FF|nr:DUF1622 domain-containing protein [Thioalkalivibrio sp. ALJ1]